MGWILLSNHSDVQEFCKHTVSIQLFTVCNHLGFFMLEWLDPWLPLKLMKIYQFIGDRLKKNKRKRIIWSLVKVIYEWGLKLILKTCLQFLTSHFGSTSGSWEENIKLDSATVTWQPDSDVLHHVLHQAAIQWSPLKSKLLIIIINNLNHRQVHLCFHLRRLQLVLSFFHAIK